MFKCPQLISLLCPRPLLNDIPDCQMNLVLFAQKFIERSSFLNAIWTFTLHTLLRKR